MKTLITATIAAAALLAAAAPAHADYAWRFDVSKAVAGNFGFGRFMPEPGVPNRLARSWIPSFGITITDAAFTRGTVDIEWAGCDGGPGSCQIAPHGDLTSLVSMTGGYLTPPGGWGSGSIDLSFTKRGRLSGSLDLTGDVSDLSLTGGPTWTGYFGSDGSECGMTVPLCEITGRWKFLGDPSPVLEPASFTLLLAGIVGLFLVRFKSIFA